MSIDVQYGLNNVNIFRKFLRQQNTSKICLTFKSSKSEFKYQVKIYPDYGNTEQAAKLVLGNSSERRHHS